MDGAEIDEQNYVFGNHLSLYVLELYINFKMGIFLDGGHPVEELVKKNGFEEMNTAVKYV